MSPTSTLEEARLPGRAGILGFARSGRALAGALLDRGVEVSIGDSAPEAAFETQNVEPLRARGARFFFGGPGPEFLERTDWLAISPGVPLTAPPVRAAKERRLPVLAEFEVAWRIAQREVRGGANRWVAVTGTNGKSTTTAWIADILRRADRPVALAGNIGVPLSAFLSETSPRDYVCELSSFQLDSVEDFSADVAVLTNVTPDHLDRYDSFDAYAASKARIFAKQTGKDAAVVNADDAVAARTLTTARRVPFSRRAPVAGGAWVQEGALVSAAAGPAREIMPAAELALPGAHNVENALAALCAVESLGAPLDAIREGLGKFAGLPHRLELVLERGGVRWVNDSKGTNVDATKKSLEGYPDGSVILILGGRDKHGDFSALAPLVARVARRVLTIGEAAAIIGPHLGKSAQVERSETMDRAVARAAEIARPGDTVLLSPACASFDRYRNFEERGAHFARLVRQTVDGRR